MKTPSKSMTVATAIVFMFSMETAFAKMNDINADSGGGLFMQSILSSKEDSLYAVPPGIGAGSSEINDYLNALAEAPEAHPSNHDGSMMVEHMAAMDLVSRGDATHVAIGDGDWDDPNVWSNRQVPDDDARVLIPEGVTVQYGSVNGARLFTVRVDGALDFATDADSKMIFDTLVVSPTGHLVVGTEHDPVDQDVSVNLIVANNGPIDTDWDPSLLSRGIISHGEATFHGAAKDSHLKVVEDPMAGDSSLQFSEVPEGWMVGDTIVIAGARYDGYKWDSAIDGKRHYEPEDEVRVITSIHDDGRVFFDEPLFHDHDSPREDLKVSVANYTRNISVETENAEDAAVFERGHVMFMHSDEVDVRYTEFHELGRTDKSFDSRPADDFNNIQFDSNVQGRYSLHIHRAGFEDLDDPAVLMGNAVFGSPGWGFVHHDSNALLENNASYNTFGAGFVAETGNETGAWTDNIAIYAQGISWGRAKGTNEVTDSMFDTARGGSGFWFQGRLVDASDNVAASVNEGFVYFHRDGDDRMIGIDSEHFAFPEALVYGEDIRAGIAPIREFENNETFAAKEGLVVIKANPKQGHDVWSELNGFTAWSVQSGAHLEYTAHYILKDFDIVGKDPTAFSDPKYGISLGVNTFDIVIDSAQIDGFDIGIDLLKKTTDNTNLPNDEHNYVLLDVEIKNAEIALENYNPALDQVLDTDSLPESTLDLVLDGPLTYDAGSKLFIEGTKVDGLGESEFPAGVESFALNKEEMANLLETKGYWTTEDGQDYTLFDLYFTDRATGGIYYETHPIYIENSVPLGGVTDNGTQDIKTQNGKVMVP